MPQVTANSCQKASDMSPRDVEFRAIISGMTCACAQTGTHADAPLAQALFHRVEVMDQAPARAARALGLAPGDADYLLAGLREDLAKDFVRAMLAENLTSESAQQEDDDDE